METPAERCIVQAFNELIAQADFERISVGMICERAGVSRATFYRHFKDKYAVMNQNYKELLDRLIRPDACPNYRELFLRLFEARPTWQRIARAFKTTGVNSLSVYIADYSYDAALEVTRRARNGEGFTPAEALQMDVFCYGVSHMYERWVAGDYALEPAEAADALFAVFPESLRYPFEL